MTTKSDAFVQEFVLGFGFLGGLFTWAGVDPEEEVIRALLSVLMPDNELGISLILFLIAIISMVASILGTYAMAGKPGVLVVGMAWLSGLIIAVGDTASVIGAFLLIAVLILGPIVSDGSNQRR